MILLEHKYFFRQQVSASAVYSTLLHKHSFLADFRLCKAFVNACQCDVDKKLV